MEVEAVPGTLTPLRSTGGDGGGGGVEGADLLSLASVNGLFEVQFAMCNEAIVWLLSISSRCGLITTLNCSQLKLLVLRTCTVCTLYASREQALLRYMCAPYMMSDWGIKLHHFRFHQISTLHLKPIHQ